MSRPKLSTAEVRAALRNRHPSDKGAWAFLEEVRNGTGYQRTTRSADALAMSLWPSRGLEIHGFEIKVSRSDWKRELEEPAKAEVILRFCDRWWLAVGDEEIVQPGELPPTWGLLIPRGKGLVAKVEAPKLEAQPITRLFLASLLRNAHSGDEEALRALVDQRAEERIKQLRESFEESAQRDRANFDRRVAELEESIAAFEKASGVSISGWNAGRVGQAVETILRLGQRWGNDRLDSMAQNLESLASQLRAAETELRALRGSDNSEAA